METQQWSMQEQFYFPEALGIPQNAENIKITAGFTEHETSDSIQLSGIYHIAANVQFTEGERTESIHKDAVLVDDVEFTDANGYFEYAVPLTIDLPNDVSLPIAVKPTNIQTTFDDNGALLLSWDVQCSSESPSAVAFTEEVKEDVVAQVEQEYEEVKEDVVAQAKEVYEEVKEDAVAQVEEEYEEQKEAVAYAIQEERITTAIDQDDVLAFLDNLPDNVTTTVFSFK